MGEHLEEWLRGQRQGLIQEVLEQEVTEFLRRARSVRAGRYLTTTPATVTATHRLAG